MKQTYIVQHTVRRPDNKGLKTYGSTQFKNVKTNNKAINKKSIDNEQPICYTACD